MRRKRKRKSEEEKRRILDGYDRSRQTQRDYAGRVGVGLSTLGFWRRQQTRGRRTRLVEVDLPAVAGQGAPTKVVGGAAYRILLPTGMKLEIGRGFDVGELKGLLGVLKELW